MSTKGYTVLGWAVWQIGSRVAKRKIAQNRAKIGAAGVILLVVLGGIAAAREGPGEWRQRRPRSPCRARCAVRRRGQQRDACRAASPDPAWIGAPAGPA